MFCGFNSFVHYLYLLNLQNSVISVSVLTAIFQVDRG